VQPGQWLVAMFLGCAAFVHAHAATVVYNFGSRDANPSPVDYLDKAHFVFKPADPKGGSLAVDVRGYSDTVPGMPSAVIKDSDEQKFKSAVIGHMRNGLGLCNKTEEKGGCAEPSYYIDNFGDEGEDWLLFTFDQVVDFKSVEIYARTNAYDYDVSYWYGEMTDAQIAAGLEDQSFESFIRRFGRGTDTNDASSLALHATGNFLLIGAHQFYQDPSLKDGTPDYVFVQSLTVDDMAVPAPTSIVLFASGLLMLAGLRIRRMTQ